MSIFKRPVSRQPNGTYNFNLSRDEQMIIGFFSQQLSELIVRRENGEPTAELDRLYPEQVAYKDDEKRSADYASLVHDDLVKERLERLKFAAEAVQRPVLDADEVHRLLGALNDMRLALGTKLDLGEEIISPNFFKDPEEAAYLYFSALLDMITQERLKGFEDDEVDLGPGGNN